MCFWGTYEGHNPKCHTCGHTDKVIRFTSDVYSFCSNECLNQYLENKKVKK
jgi:endogenous inhibitor of DNA gyrase (YacG/DUF329 family)